MDVRAIPNVVYTDPEIFERTTLRFDIVCEIARDVACVRERGPS